MEEDLSRSGSAESAATQPLDDPNATTSDWALALALQQQEWADRLFHEGSDTSKSESENSVDDSLQSDYEAEDKIAGLLSEHSPPDLGISLNDQEMEITPSLFELDEALARALQEAEVQAAAEGDDEDERNGGSEGSYEQGLLNAPEDERNESRHISLEDERNSSEDAMEGRSNALQSEDDEDDEDDEEDEDDEDDLDIDNMSYEELLALGERIGTHSRGLDPDIIAALPCSQFVHTSEESASNECVICRLDYEDGVSLSTLPCKHSYHVDCIKNWLQIKKICPICIAEVMA